jgi:fatty-acyl-CoA synthase
MQGMMMQIPLRIIDLLSYAAETHGDAGIVSARVEGDVHRQSYPQALARAARAAHALERLGVAQGDRVATLAWNGHRHFELYYAISGMGAVCHTINPRLSAEQLLYIIGHAEDQVLCLDLTFVPLVEALADKLPQGIILIALTDRAHMPESSLDLLCYEDLLDRQGDFYEWPVLDENAAAALCYTSGTTGHPKGALYSHRSTVLHALSLSLTFRQSLAPGARVLPVVPMFHVNSWGLPYAAPLTGATLVMPGPNLDGPSLWQLMENKAVTASWGVPTVWLGLAEEIKARGRPPLGLRQLVIGGSAVPRAMIEFFEGQGVDICHAWGMTEMSPVGTHGQLPPPMQTLPKPLQFDAKAKQGRRLFGVELKIVGDDGAPLPHDGRATGQLYVRGNAVVSGYFANPEASAEVIDAEGWFATGDVASIDPEGFLILRDRSKDLVKSGGEWISSIDLENLAIAHPKIANCAVIAVPHPKWDERPLLIAVPEDTADPPTLEDVHALMADHLAPWQLPDALEIVDALPLTATGKVSKLTLRQRFDGYRLPDVD